MRKLSCILIAVMLLSIFPLTALATETDGELTSPEAISVSFDGLEFENGFTTSYVPAKPLAQCATLTVDLEKVGFHIVLPELELLIHCGTPPAYAKKLGQNINWHVDDTVLIMDANINGGGDGASDYIIFRYADSSYAKYIGSFDDMSDEDLKALGQSFVEEYGTSEFAVATINGRKFIQTYDYSYGFRSVYITVVDGTQYVLDFSFVDMLSEDDMNVIENSINSIKFKPTFRMKLNIQYGFEDAMITGISYGFIGSILYFLKWIIDIPFKSKKYDFKIAPIFDKNILLLFLDCIIWLNIAKILYIMIIIIKNTKISK